MKNTVYLVVIVICLIGAGVVFLTRGSKGSGGPSDSSMIWVKCVKCNQSYEMSEKQYLNEVDKKRASLNLSPIAIVLLTCQKCNQDGIRKAYKCQNPSCGEVFFPASVPNDLADRCPKCKHSALEDKRKASGN